MSLWYCKTHGLYGPAGVCPVCGIPGESARLEPGAPMPSHLNAVGTRPASVKKPDAHDVGYYDTHIGKLHNVSMSVVPPESETRPEAATEAHNWPEDFSHENGNYNNTCCMCKIVFVGHKRRYICRVCATPESVRSETAGLRALIVKKDEALRDSKEMIDIVADFEVGEPEGPCAANRAYAINLIVDSALALTPADLADFELISKAELATLRANTWKPIEFAPGYDAHPDGLIRNTSTGMVLRQYTNHYSYRAVALKKNGKRSPHLVHRLLGYTFLGLMEGQMIDHINRDKGDNRLSNLRIATKSLNHANRPKQKDNKSGFKGVRRSTRCDRWSAEIQVNKKKIHLGCFKTPEAASAAYLSAAQEHFGAFASL